MAQSLFDDWRAQSVEQPPPKLKANILARMVRMSWRNAWAVIVIWLLITSGAAGLAFRLASLPMAPTLPIPAQGSPADKTASGFVRLDQLQTITLANADPQLLDDQRADLIQTMRQHSDIYELVFAPGTGDYYESHGMLYHATDEIKGRVAYALSLKPLFEAIANAPSAGSMATLVNEVAAGIKLGRDPQGLDELLSESAASVQALMQGEDKPVDWSRLADLDSENTSPSVTILALPRRDQAGPAAVVTDKLLNVLRTASDTQASVSRSEVVPEHIAPSAVEWPRAAAAGLISLVFAGLVLALALGRARMILVITLPVLAIVAICAMGLFGFAGAQWPSYWPLGLGIVLATMIASTHFAFSAVNHADGSPAKEVNLMLAAQERGTECVWLAGLMAAPWAGLLALGEAGIATSVVLALTAIVLGLVCVFTLAPALFRLMPEASKWRAGEWLVPAHRALFETGQWQWLARGLGAVLVAASLGVALFEPNRQQQVQLETPVTLLAKGQAEAERNIERLKSYPQAQGVRWLAMFLPTAAEEKRKALLDLKDQFPRITPVASASEQDLRDQIDTLQQSLKDIAEAASTNAKLKQAADEFRRSLALLAATSGPAQIKQLENRLFGGFNRLADRADVLTGLDTPSLETMPPELTTLFGSPSTSLRIEVIPAPGVSNANLALTLENAGFSVLHPAVTQEAEANRKISAILKVFALGLGLACLILVLAFAAVSQLLGAGVMMLASLIVLAGANHLWQGQWDLPWLLLVTAVFSSMMAALYLTPTSRGSTALSAVELFLPPALALALALPFQLLGVMPVANLLVPLGLGFGLVAVVVGLLQQHRPLSDLDAADESWLESGG